MSLSGYFASSPELSEFQTEIKSSFLKIRTTLETALKAGNFHVSHANKVVPREMLASYGKVIFYYLRMFNKLVFFSCKTINQHEKNTILITSLFSGF